LDGSGYPRGLHEDSLSFADKILAVADIFGALCSARSYKDAFPKEKVVSILKEQAGMLDENIVTIAIENYDSLILTIDRVTKPLTQKYETITVEYNTLLDMTRNFANGAAFPLTLLKTPLDF